MTNIEKTDDELMNEGVSIAGYTALILADIEEKLIKPNKNLYTTDEVLNQLTKTGKDIVTIMVQMGYSINDPIIPAPNELMAFLENTITPNKN
ncbi:MAG TPA: hypothetical protein VFV31_13015 [Chitinophagaceae bacterium]|nr:hypothetical protein [Chitinophagaceae bacterium]